MRFALLPVSLLVVACFPAAEEHGELCGFSTCAVGETCVQWDAPPFDECAAPCGESSTCGDGCPCVALATGAAVCADTCRVWEDCLAQCDSLSDPWGCMPSVPGSCDFLYRRVTCEIDCDRRFGCARCGTPADRCAREGYVRCECPAEHGFDCHDDTPAFSACEGAVTDPALSAWLAAHALPQHQGVAAALTRMGQATRYGAAGVVDGEQVVTNDVFRIGSLTKLLTAVVVLLLVEEGAVALDAPVLEYGVDVHDARVTVRQLLSHQSGLSDYFTPVLLEEWRAPHEPEALIARATPSTPGQSFSYANTNYVALGLLIESVTGVPFHVALRQRLLDPLELTATYLLDAESGPLPLAGVTWTAGEHVPTDGAVHPSVAWAAGALASDVSDLARAMEALLVTPSVLDAATAQEMLTGTLGGYGLGVYETPLCGGSATVRHHTGYYPGAGCAFLGFQPATGVGVVLLSQTDDGVKCASFGALACELAAASSTL